jgi:mRNA interferase HigB
MRIISRRMLREFWRKHADAEGPLRDWVRIIRFVRWRSFVDVRRTFGSADVAKAAGGNDVAVFDICGNRYRLIAGIHYNTGIVYVLMVLTHDEYSANRWKERL